MKMKYQECKDLISAIKMMVAGILLINVRQMVEAYEAGYLVFYENNRGKVGISDSFVNKIMRSMYLPSLGILSAGYVKQDGKIVAKLANAHHRCMAIIKLVNILKDAGDDDSLDRLLDTPLPMTIVPQEISEDQFINVDISEINHDGFHEMNIISNAHHSHTTKCHVTNPDFMYGREIKRIEEKVFVPQIGDSKKVLAQKERNVAIMRGVKFYNFLSYIIESYPKVCSGEMLENDFYHGIDSYTYSFVYCKIRSEVTKNITSQGGKPLSEEQIDDIVDALNYMIEIFDNLNKLDAEDRKFYSLNTNIRKLVPFRGYVMLDRLRSNFGEQYSFLPSTPGKAAQVLYKRLFPRRCYGRSLLVDSINSLRTSNYKTSNQGSREVNALLSEKIQRSNKKAVA